MSVVSLSIPQTSLGYWMERLIRHGVRYEGPVKRFGEQVLAFEDPGGLALELVATEALGDRLGWAGGPVPVEHAIRGVHAVTLWGEGHEPTARLLTETLGFRPAGEEGSRFRYELGHGGPGALVDVIDTSGFWRGVVASGTVHHVAWRTPNDEQQKEWQAELTRLGVQVTPVQDRQYFRSIYFREPGGVLFEIATDEPGFAVDEAPEELGAALKLPPWLEARRPSIERALPEIRLQQPETIGGRE